MHSPLPLFSDPSVDKDDTGFPIPEEGTWLKLWMDTPGFKSVPNAASTNPLAAAEDEDEAEQLENKSDEEQTPTTRSSKKQPSVASSAVATTSTPALQRQVLEIQLRVLTKLDKYMDDSSAHQVRMEEKNSETLEVMQDILDGIDKLNDNLQRYLESEGEEPC